MEKIWRWKNGILQKQDSLLEGLQITEKEVISVVGACGKTTTIRRLANEMEKRQKRVAVTTTTRMKKEAQFLLAADFPVQAAMTSGRGARLSNGLAFSGQ